MLISEVQIPELKTYGLKNIHMRKLGRVVVLAGKNGSGKSRLISRIAAWKERFEDSRQLSPCAISWAIMRMAAKSGASEAVAPSWLDPATRKQVAEKYRFNPRTIWPEMYWLEFDQQSEHLKWWIESDGHEDKLVFACENREIVHFVPKKLDLANPEEISQREMLKRSAEYLFGVEDLHQNALARIRVLQNRWWSVTHQKSEFSTAEREDAISQYEALNSLIQRFLGVSLGRNIDGSPTLSGLPIGNARLSDGQIILLQFSVAVHAQSDRLSELIVLMDEPENHLHPGAMLDAIGAIQDALINGQLWIATHSIPLLSHFDPDCIWWMHDGTVQHAGSQPEVVLKSLLGDDERINRTGDFLALPAVLAANNFAYQCLLPPCVVTTGANDPQTLQIARILEAKNAGKKMHVLDFGAGRGRLVSALREGGATAEVVKSRIDYLAYDPLEVFRTECEAAIERLYGSSEGRYFSGERAIRGKIDPGSVDVVVMCNVLHEIDPLEWVKLFSPQGIIRTLLGHGGFLLLVEDLDMRVGEKAHQRGFLVLDTADLRRFFAIRAEDSEFLADDARGDGRLKAHLIPASCLGRATVETLRNTLKQVKYLAARTIEELRQLPANYRQGRKHAFQVHQLANATLALEQLGEP